MKQFPEIWKKMDIKIDYLEPVWTTDGDKFFFFVLELLYDSDVNKNIVPKRLKQHEGHD